MARQGRLITEGGANAPARMWTMNSKPSGDQMTGELTASLAMDDKTLLQLFTSDENATWTGPNGIMAKAAVEIVRLRFELKQIQRNAKAKQS